MPSRFHNAALALLGVDYAVDPYATLALEARARTFGITFPASFIEWCGMRDGLTLLQDTSHCDEPVPIAKLGNPMQWRWAEDRDLLRDDLLVFMVENQGVCVWAVRLNAGDDPPVVVARDPDLAWRSCAEHFSTFIDCQAWAHLHFSPHSDGLLVAAQDVPLRPADLAHLRGRYAERATTHGWPGDNQYRFEGNDARVLIWDAEDQADWWISSPTEDGLARTLSVLWECGDLRGSLWTNDDRAERVLESLRRR